MVKYWLMKMIKKIVFVLGILIFLAAEASALYMRKLKEPDFFIPESDKMHKIEKLPEVEGLKNSEKKKKVVFKKVPSYKEKYGLYKDKLDEFVKTGVFTKDESLEKDIAEMNEEKVFEVVEEAPKTFETKEQFNFYVLANKLIEN